MVMFWPSVTVIVGFGVPVLFQADMKPTRVIVCVEAAETLRLSGKLMTVTTPVAIIRNDRTIMDILRFCIEKPRLV